MIRFYYHPTPNPAKIALFLEETGLPYEIVPVDTSKGEQHTAEFREINPNGKVPAIVDTDGPGGAEVRVFDSSAILLYLGEKTGKLMGSPADRGELLSWLFYIAPGLGRFPAKPCTSSARPPRSCPTRSTGIGARRNATTRFSTGILKAGTSSSAAAIPSPTSRRGAGLTAPAWCLPAVTIRSPPTRTSGGGSTRSVNGRQSSKRGR